MLDFSALWTWALLFTRFTGMFFSLPGIGTDQVPESLKILPALIIAACVVIGGAKVDYPQTMAEGALMLFSEFSLGYLLGMIPSIIIGGIAVAGQIISGSIGSGQANMLDLSLGEPISVLSRIKIQLAIFIFLLIDGHHYVIKAAAGISRDIGIGMFRANGEIASFLIARFSASFEFSLILCTPIIVAALLTQFILGLITKFIPQINVFIISMPLTLLVGLYIMGETMPGFMQLLLNNFVEMENVLSRI